MIATSRKLTRAQIRARHEAAQRQKSYAIILVETAQGWGFVHDVVPQTIIRLVPAVDLTVYSCLAYAFDRADVQHWAARIATEQHAQTTVIPVEERWEQLHSSGNLIAMAQRYAPAHLVQQTQQQAEARLNGTPVC